MKIQWVCARRKEYALQVGTLQRTQKLVHRPDPLEHVSNTPKIRPSAHHCTRYNDRHTESSQNTTYGGLLWDREGVYLEHGGTIWRIPHARADGLPVEDLSGRNRGVRSEADVLESSTDKRV